MRDGALLRGMCVVTHLLRLVAKVGEISVMCVFNCSLGATLEITVPTVRLIVGISKQVLNLESGSLIIHSRGLANPTV